MSGKNKSWVSKSRYIPIYGARFWVGVSPEMRNFHRLAPKELLPAMDEVFDDSGGCLVWAGRRYGLFFPTEELKHGRIAHEVFHLTHRIMQHTCDDFPRHGTHEPYAYLNEWLTTSVYDELHRRGITKIRV